MENDKLYDITEVCRMLGTTSRTLRFYEEKGIVESTTVGLSSRRRYTGEQLSTVRNVLVLRTLGLPIKTISELQKKGADLKDAILSRRAEIYASIHQRVREIDLLNEALFAMEKGKDLFAGGWQHTEGGDSEALRLAAVCAAAVLNGDTEALYAHFSPRMAEYLPRNVYEIVRKDSFLPLGDFVAVEKTAADSLLPSKFYQYVKFSKLGLKITLVFYHRQIEGLWLGYYDTKAKKV